MTLPDDLKAITPINFFQLSADILQLPEGAGDHFPSLNKKNYRKYLLPDTSQLCGETVFAEMAIGWHFQGIEIFLCVQKPFKQSCYPNVESGDSVEVFFDTRDVKTSGFNTKFCHHFFFLPEGVDGVSRGEITHFRTEDKHPLCNSEELKHKMVQDKGNYLMQIFIPHSCLVGYDPQSFNRLGFTYRINRSKGFSQHFSVVSEDFKIEQQPSLWASLTMCKK